MPFTPTTALLRGAWDVRQQSIELQEDKHQMASDWLTASVGSKTDEPGVELRVTYPGVHTLYYAHHKGRIRWSERKLDIINHFMRVGHTPTIHRVEGGTTVHFNGKRLWVTEDVWPETPTVVSGVALDDAAQGLWERLVKATDEMLCHTHKHVVCLSGGTDSLMVAAALKQLNAPELVAVSVGSSPDVFDVAYARKYAQQLGIQHVYIPFPEGAEVQRLVQRAMVEYEWYDVSNMYMAMCNLLIRDWAEQNSRDGIWQGYYADRLLGHSLTMKSNYVKHLGDREEPNDQNWADWRWNLYLHVTQNDEQVAKTLRGGKTYWRTPFLAKEVRDYTTTLPLAVAPYTYESRKILFEAASNKLVDGGSWLVGKKKGYYTGAGIGVLAKTYPCLTTEGLQSMYRRLRLLKQVG